MFCQHPLQFVAAALPNMEFCFVEDALPHATPMFMLLQMRRVQVPRAKMGHYQNCIGDQ